MIRFKTVDTMGVSKKEIFIAKMVSPNLKTDYESGIAAEGKNLMRKLERDQMHITPRKWRTFNRVPSELFMAMVWDVVSAPLTEKDSAVTN